MKKINISVDVLKLKKDKFVKGKEYQGHTPLEARLTGIIQDEDKHKVIWENDTTELWKIGFVAQEGKKEEDLPIVGSITRWADKEMGEAPGSFQDIQPEEVPF